MVADIDWESHHGHYRVRIDGEWVMVPDGAVVTQPDKTGAHRGLEILYRQPPPGSLVHAGDHDLRCGLSECVTILAPAPCA